MGSTLWSWKFENVENGLYKVEVEVEVEVLHIFFAAAASAGPRARNAILGVIRNTKNAKNIQKIQKNIQKNKLKIATFCVKIVNIITHDMA